GGVYLAPDEGHWDDLKKLAGELHEMSPVFMSETDDRPVTVSPADAKISACIKRGKDGLVLLAANRSTTPVDVTIDSATITAGDMKVRYEDRTVRAAAGRLSDHFEPLAVHVYTLAQ